MAEHSWHEARLIPTSGINGADEQERRATSALLAVVGAVREFSNALLRPLGAPAGRAQTYIEVPFDLGGQKLFPDGLVRVARGSRSWTALVEVKTGSNRLEAGQLENYLDIARGEGYDAVVTISNEIPPAAGQHPTTVDRRKLRKVALHHWSWSEVLATAVMQKEFRGVADPDQAWILGELIRYLEHRRSGAMEFEDMGEHWTSVRDAVRSGTFQPRDDGGVPVAANFDALLRFASLNLGRRLGTEVVPQLSRREIDDPGLRTQALLRSLSEQGEMSGAIRVPQAAGPITVTADVRASQIRCQMDVAAADHARSATRVKWLLRQLEAAPTSTRIETYAAYGRGAAAAEVLSAARENPSTLVPDGDRLITRFRVVTITPLGSKRGRGRGCFIDSVLDAVDAFYGDVVAAVKVPSNKPPVLRMDDPVVMADRPSLLSSTDFSSQDDPEPPVPDGEGHGQPAPVSETAEVTADSPSV